MPPNNLREYAQMTKDVVVIGVANRVELWSKELWDEYMDKATASYEEIMEKIVELGI